MRRAWYVARRRRKDGGEKSGSFARQRGFCNADLAFQSGESVHQELAEIGESHGIRPRDAAMGELFDDVSQIQVDGARGRKVADAGEQLGSGGLRILRKCGLLQSEVAKAKTGLLVQNAKTATAASGGVVSTARFGVALRRAGYNGLIGHGWILR